LANGPVAVIGAGIAGLTAAIDLARSGHEVVVFERAATPGGKLRQVHVAGRAMDAGPTVFTLRSVFEELFDDAGDDFARRVRLISAKVLARHAWSAHERLDLYSDIAQSAEAIGSFAGRHDAQGFLRFSAHAKRIYDTLDRSFMRASRPSMPELVRRVGLSPGSGLWAIEPFTTLWRSMGRYFKDERLQQLFGRYATYCGSSPFAAPATLMLVAHVEQAGVWYLDGGMYELAVQLAALAQRQGATFRYGSEIVHMHLERGRIAAIETAAGERIAVEAVICNADTNAIAGGLFGRSVQRGVRPTVATARSLSAVTWNVVAGVAGFDLAHHTVFFSRKYRAEFDDIFVKGRIPTSPTIYVCAQDRHDHDRQHSAQGEQHAPRGVAASTAAARAAAKGVATGVAAERLLCLVNAPPIGDRHVFESTEIDACETRVFQALANFGLILTDRQAQATSPTQFNQLFPATGGALYGPASHGWMASFKRAGSRTSIPGLYLAGGSSHPGPGVPMAAISGRLAAASLMADSVSTVPSPRAVMRGGTSTP
jgi:1-hydroxycarotenoid 3,4-desaturase